MTTQGDMPRNPNAPTITVNHEGVIQDVSPAFEKAFGWQGDHLQGELLTRIIPDKLRDAHHLGFSRFLMTGRPTILEQFLNLEILCGDGRIQPARHYITAGQEAGHWIFTAVIYSAEMVD